VTDFCAIVLFATNIGSAKLTFTYIKFRSDGMLFRDAMVSSC